MPMALIGPLQGAELLVILVFLVIWAAIWVVPFWRIFTKAGFPPELAFLMVIPGVQLVILWVFAFSHWPGIEDLDRDRQARSEQT